MKAITVKLNLERSTKNKHVFAETGDASAHKMGTVYINKTAFTEDPPASIEITIK